MTTTTAPRVTREILTERWRAAVTKATRSQRPNGDRDMTLDNSDAFYRWEENVAEIATRLRGDHLDPDELEEVESIAAEIWDATLRERLLAWAEERAV